MRSTAALLAGIFVFCLSLGVSAHAAGTAQEAKAMVEKAVAFMKANGKEKAYAEFTSQSGQFKKDDLYIFVIDLKGLTLAHGGNPKLVGMSLMDLKDPTGKLFIKDLVDSASAKGSGWSDYQWPHPVTKKVEKKSTYFQRVDDLVVGCGVYK